MTTRKLGNTKILEFETRDEALAYAEAKEGYRQLWQMIVVAELTGLLSPN